MAWTKPLSIQLSPWNAPYPGLFQEYLPFGNLFSLTTDFILFYFFHSNDHLVAFSLIKKAVTWAFTAISVMLQSAWALCRPNQVRFSSLQYVHSWHCAIFSALKPGEFMSFILATRPSFSSFTSSSIVLELYPDLGWSLYHILPLWFQIWKGSYLKIGSIIDSVLVIRHGARPCKYICVSKGGQHSFEEEKKV